MGVSFKVAKMGTRYRSRLAQTEDEGDDDDETGSVDSQTSVNQVTFSGVGNKIFDLSNVLAKTRVHSASDDIEVSFSLNLFPNGFSIGKVSESFNNAPEQLYPYNRASETLFSAIEYGWLPGDAFDDLPFKYVNGSVLCEIQDYRNCLIHKEGFGSTQKSPIVHRVILQMCMENVVKDMVSMSDESWTYKDLLEVESHILKALQPNLCLNPQPLLGKHYREPLAKKVNLEISWSWEKGELCNAPATNQVFSNSYHVTVMPGNSACQNSNFQFGLVHLDRGAICAKENIPTSVNQKHNSLQEMNSHSYPLTSPPNCHLGETRDLSTLAELTTSSVSVSKRSSIKRTRDQTKPTSSNLNVKVRCQKQAIQGPLLKKPKKELVECSYLQCPGKSIEIRGPPQLWQQNTVLHQQMEAEKVLPERFQDKGCPSQLIKNDLPSNCESIFYLQNIEPAQTCFPNFDYGNVKDRRVNPSAGVQFQYQQSLHLSKTNNPIENTLQKPITQPIDKYLRKGNVTSTRKGLEKSQLIYDVSAPAGSKNVDSLPKEASAPLKRKATPLNSFSINLVDSSPNINNVNTANANSLSEGIHLLLQTSESKGVPLLERFVKIEEVTQRCKLTTKHKLDQNLVRKQSFHATPLVAFFLSSFEDSRDSQAITMDKVSFSPLSMGRSDVFNARTLTFVPNHSPFCQGNEIYVDGREVQVRLILAQKFNQGTVEANLLYGCENETTSTVLSPLPTFPNSHSADLFASQFSLLMAREGYHLASDRVEPMYPETEGSSSSQQRSTINQSAGTFELSASTLTPGFSPHMLSPMIGNMSVHNSSQLLSKQTFPNTQLLPLPVEDLQSSPQFTSNCGIAAQFSSMPQQMEEMMSRRLQLQLQIKQRQRQQELLLQRKAILARSAVTAGSSGTLQLRGRNGIQCVSNLSLSSSGNVTGPMAYRPKILRGHMPLSENNLVGLKNNLCSNTLGLNESKQLVTSSSDYLAEVSSKLKAADGQWRGLAGRVPIQRNGLLVPINRPKVPEIPCTLSTQQQPQLQMYLHEMQRAQPCILQQEMRWPIENLESVNFGKQQLGSSLTQLNLESADFAQQVGSSLSQLSPQQFAQQPQINQKQQNHPGSVLEEMKKRKTMGSYGRVERGYGWK